MQSPSVSWNTAQRGGGVDMTRNAKDAQSQRHKLQTTYEDDIYQIPSMVPTTQQTKDKQQANTTTNLVIIQRRIPDQRQHCHWYIHYGKNAIRLTNAIHLTDAGAEIVPPTRRPTEESQTAATK